LRFAADKCNAYFNEMASSGDLRVCGMCLYVCPFGKKRNGNGR
jgi:epoxyqueuosine reductase QueG